MSKFYALEMAKTVSAHPNLMKQDRFFGLLHNVVYKPTDSIVESYSNYYKEEDAQRFKSLIESKDEQLEAHIESLKDAYCEPGESFRLDICASQDGQFIAMQLNHVANNITTHITPIRYFEGKEALKVDKIF